MHGTDQRLYLYADQNKAVGILKVGKKRLFIRSAAGSYNEIEPLCVLDFYVHETFQRSGIGKTMFEVWKLDCGCAQLAHHAGWSPNALTIHVHWCQTFFKNVPITDSTPSVLQTMYKAGRTLEDSQK